MAVSGVLLDLDGTLIASNQTHVEAWGRSLHEHGYGVAPDRIALEVGKGGDHLVGDLLGRSAEEKHGDALRESEGRWFSVLALKSGLQVAPDAVDLIAALKKRGIVTALATSSKPEHLDVAERASGVRWRALVDHVVSASDVAASKPSPDIVHAALHKMKLTAAQCAMLGDTRWDAIAARRAGVTAIGLTYGGKDATTLYRAGARVVYGDTAELSRRLDAALEIASPATLTLDRRSRSSCARRSPQRKTAWRAVRSPSDASSRAVTGRSSCVGTTASTRRATWRATQRHAEIDAFDAASGKLEPGARDTILVSTLEPCVMCTGAAMQTAVDLIVYGVPAPEDGGTRRVTPPDSDESQVPRAVGPILPGESRTLFERWLASPDHNRQQEPYVRKLLQLTR